MKNASAFIFKIYKTFYINDLSKREKLEFVSILNIKESELLVINEIEKGLAKRREKKRRGLDPAERETERQRGREMDRDR